MVKNKKKDNSLIKRNNLVMKLKEFGLNRVSPGSVLKIEKVMKEKLEKIIKKLKEEVITKGRNTLKEEDVDNVVNKKNEDSGWEI